MSTSGQYNQTGIKFQNKVALLYMLDHYKYDNFLKIKFEGDEFEDFTLFFMDRMTQSSFFYEFEVKNRKDPLKLSQVRGIAKKEVEKGIGRYSDQNRFFIVAPSFSEGCKNHIRSFSNYLFPSGTDFDSNKQLYEEAIGKHPVPNWSKEEIIFIKKVDLVELDEQSVDKRIREHFHYEQSFFYTEANAQNIISLLFFKITNASSKGGV